jgi:uncharacterized membrane-anchored protein
MPAQLAIDSAIVLRDDAVVAVFDPCRKKALAIPDHYISGLPNPINPLSRLASMIARELATTPSTASHFDFNVRAVPPTTPFWIAMYVASGLGTNLGDLYAQYLALGLVASFLLTMIVSAILIYADLKNGAKTETFFWTAIVIFRAGATNIGDFITHNLHVNYALASLVLAAATIAAGAATRPAPGGASPMIDLRYWGAMFIAGVFGTIFGDLVAHATTFFAAFLTLGAALALVIYARRRFAPAAIIGYWAIVLVERAAGTPLGDWLDSRHGLGLGLPIASTITTALLLATLEWRRRAKSAGP